MSQAPKVIDTSPTTLIEGQSRYLRASNNIATQIGKMNNVDTTPGMPNANKVIGNRSLKGS